MYIMKKADILYIICFIGLLLNRFKFNDINSYRECLYPIYA